jgi:UDP-N-acetyl-D-mannosaminuronic acid dehydrogenase
MIVKDKQISVIGLGYIGLPTAALLASNGYKVNGMDVNKDVVSIINEGKIHIVEPELDKYVKSAVSSNMLQAFIEVQPADIYIICVPTPFSNNLEIPSPNIDYVKDAALNISVHVKKGDIIILESTSPVGTTEMIETTLKEKGIDTNEIFIAYCPERVLPGKIMKELVENARVIGGLNHKSTEVVSQFYKTFVKGKILMTKAGTAEMCKLTENSFRDVNIAFANELSILCHNNGVNVWDLIDLANHHPRVNILQPGTGVGGHCIAVDPWFIVSQDPGNARLIKTARAVNDYKPEWVVKQIQEEAEKINTKNIACLGLAFKPDIDDLRESPAISVVDSLLKQGYKIKCVEPNIDNHKKYDLVSLDEAIEECDVIALLVKHKEFNFTESRTQIVNKSILNFCEKSQ